MPTPQIAQLEASPSEICPHLGLREDTETCLAYPSPWNLCTQAKPSAGVSLEHQRQTCLTPAYRDCPVLKRERTGPLPGALRAPRPKKALPRQIWLFLLFLLLGGVFWIARAKLPVEAWGAFQSGLWPGKSGPSSAAVAAAPPTARATLPERTALSPQPDLPVPSLPIEPSPSAPALNCGYALEQPVRMGEHEIILHQVADGENMILLAERYATSMEAMIAINYFIPSPLWSELVIVIPNAPLDVNDLPILEPFQLEAPQASLEQVAGLATVDLPDLLRVHPLDPACGEYSGWILVPRPQKKTP